MATGYDRLIGLKVIRANAGELPNPPRTIIGHHLDIDGDLMITFVTEDGYINCEHITRWQFTEESLKVIVKSPMEMVGDYLKALMIGMGADPEEVTDLNLFELISSK